MYRVTYFEKAECILVSHVHKNLNEIFIKLSVYRLNSILKIFEIALLITFLKKKEIEDKHNKKRKHADNNYQSSGLMIHFLVK